MARPNGAAWFVRLLACIRFDEVLVLQGAPVFGAVFSIGALNAQSAANFLLLAVGNCFFVAHVFLLNDWAGIEHDLQDPSRSARVFLNKGIRRNEILGLSLSLLVAGLALFGMLGSITLIIGLIMALASVLYSAPAFHMKGLPLINSVLHLVSGFLHFLLGYSAFRVIDARGIEIACYFAAIFCAGHLTHEVRDYQSDLGNGIKTNAVRFGKVPSFLAGFVLFRLADALLIAMVARGTLSRHLLLVAAFYPLHFYWAFLAMRDGLTFESVRRLQVRYRVLYAAVGLAMLGSELLA